MPIGQFLANALQNAQTGISNQWDNGRPYREAMGAALTGHLADAGQILSDKVASISPQDLNEGIMNFGVGMVGNIKGVGEGLMPNLDYQIEHKPMKIEGGASPLHDLSSSFDDTIYGNSSKALQNYGSGDIRERQILNIFKQVRGNPDAPVTIYRGAPTTANGINVGDWVTLHPQVAQDYANQAIENQGIPSKVFSKQVPASHVTAWPDSLLEQGYYPPQ